MATNRSQQGLTLIELLVVMGLLSIFVVVLTDIFVAVARVRTESEATPSVAVDGRFILSRLSYDVNRAASVTTPAALGGSGSSLAIVIDGVTNTYAVSGGNLQVTNGSGTNNLNGSETTIPAFTVQRIGNAGGKDTLRLSLTVTSDATSDSGQEVTTYTTTVGRR